MCVHAQSLSHVQLFATLWTVAQQATLSMGFPRQENESGLLFSTLIFLTQDKPTSLVSPALAGKFFATAPPRKPQLNYKD